MPVLSIRIVLDSFYLLIFYSEKFSTWIWRFLFAVNLNLNLSIKPVELYTSGTVNCLFFFDVTMGISPRQLFLEETLPRGQQPLAVERLVHPHLIFVINDIVLLDGWSKRKKSIKINNFSESPPSFFTNPFPFQHWEERKIKAGIWPCDCPELFESFEESLKFTVRPEHEVLAIPSLRWKDVALVVFWTVAVYVTPARIAILWEKCTSNVWTLELVE